MAAHSHLQTKAAPPGDTRSDPLSAHSAAAALLALRYRELSTPRAPRAGRGRSGVCAPARARGDTPLGALVPRQPARWLSGGDPPSPGSSPHTQEARVREAARDPCGRPHTANRCPVQASRVTPAGAIPVARGPRRAARRGAGVCAARAASAGGRKGFGRSRVHRAPGREAAGPRRGDRAPLSLGGCSGLCTPSRAALRAG